jgi:hypothetical protein
MKEPLRSWCLECEQRRAGGAIAASDLRLSYDGNQSFFSVFNSIERTWAATN